MTPMVPWALGEGHQPLPISREALDGRWRQLAVALGTLLPQLLACRLTLGVGHGTETRARRGLLVFRDRSPHIGDPLVPAPLFGRGGLLFTARRPEDEVAVGHRTAPGWPPAVAAVAQDGSPRLL